MLGSLSPAEFRLLMSEFNRSYRAIEALRVPTVAAVRGSVSGAVPARGHGRRAREELKSARPRLTARALAW